MFSCLAALRSFVPWWYLLLMRETELFLCYLPKFVGVIRHQTVQWPSRGRGEEIDCSHFSHHPVFPKDLRVIVFNSL